MKNVEVAKALIKSVKNSQFNALMDYDDARERMHEAFREVSDKPMNIEAAERLLIASTQYYASTKTLETAEKAYSKTRLSLFRNGFSEEEIDRLER